MTTEITGNRAIRSYSRRQDFSVIGSGVKVPAYFAFVSITVAGVRKSAAQAHFCAKTEAGCVRLAREFALATITTD